MRKSGVESCCVAHKHTQIAENCKLVRLSSVGRVACGCVSNEYWMCVRIAARKRTKKKEETAIQRIRSIVERMNRLWRTATHAKWMTMMKAGVCSPPSKIYRKIFPPKKLLMATTTSHTSHKQKCYRVWSQKKRERKKGSSYLTEWMSQASFGCCAPV